MSAIAQTRFGIECSFETHQKRRPLWPRTPQTKTGAALQIAQVVDEPPGIVALDGLHQSIVRELKPRQAAPPLGPQ